MSGLGPTGRAPEAISRLPLQADKAAGSLQENKTTSRNFIECFLNPSDLKEANAPSDSGRLISSYAVREGPTHLKRDSLPLGTVLGRCDFVLFLRRKEELGK